MNTDAYLTRFQAELKGFSAEETAALVDEIRAHIEDGQADPRMGPAGQREAKLAAEMGSPSELGRGFKEVYHPRRWVDFLLVFVPYVFLRMPILWLVTVLFSEQAGVYNMVFTSPMMIAQIRVTIAMNALLTLVALRRRSLPTLFFWLPQTILTTYVLIFRETRWMADSPFNAQLAGMLGSAFWLIFLAGLVTWLGYLIWQQRRSALLVVLAVLPFLMTLGNLALNPYLANGLFPGGYNLPMWNIATVGGFPLGLYQVSALAWPVLFYLFPQRLVRWLGLFLCAVPLALMNLIASLRYPQLAVMWAIPIVLVLGAWMIDFRNHPARPERVR